MKLSKSEKIFNVFNVLFMIFFLALIIFPLLNILALSFNDGQDAMKGGIYFWPREFTLDNYKEILSNPQLYTSFVVSVAKTIVGVVGHVVVTGCAAYAMSKKSLMGRSIFIKMGVVTMFFAGGMIPTFLLMDSLGLINTFWVFIFPALFSFYDMIIFMNFFKGIPSSLEESAEIDGATFFQTFTKIIVPLSMPVIATIALFHGVFQWNDYMTAKLYVTDPALYPMSYYLYLLLNSTAAATSNEAGVYIQNSFTSQSLQQAAMVVTTLPIILVYPFLQKHFISGMLVGGVKE